MSGAQARSRSVTLASLAASSSSGMAGRSRGPPGVTGPRPPPPLVLGKPRPPRLPRLLRRVHRDPALRLHHHAGGIADGLAGVPADAGLPALAAGCLSPAG